MDERWRIPREVWLAVGAGLVSGVAGSLLFATAHAIVIVPIWDRMWSGFVSGAVAGMAAGWALVEVAPRVLSTSPWRATALGAGFGGLLWLLVAPVTLIDMVLRRSGIREQSEFIEVAVAVTLAIAAGGAFAWWRTRRWRATIAGALATLLLTVAMAGPVPIGNGARAVRIFLAVLPVAVLAGGVLAVVVRYAARTLVSPTEKAAHVVRAGHD